MKLLLGWFFVSSVISLVIIVNAPKILPVGEHTARNIITSTELNLLNILLKKESIDEGILHTLIKERRSHFKADVIGSQIALIPTTLIYFSLLIINILNILFIIIGVWYVKYIHQAK